MQRCHEVCKLAGVESHRLSIEKRSETNSRGQIPYATRHRSEDTEEFKELSKEYQSGYGVKT